MILLDTHVVVWLYGGHLNLIPAPVQGRLNREPLGISPFVQLELAYLHEVGRVTASAQSVVDELRERLELAVVNIDAHAVCKAALTLGWTRDPFDRLQAAHSIVTGMPLVTRDQTLRRHLSFAWWAE